MIGRRGLLGRILAAPFVAAAAAENVTNEAGYYRVSGMSAVGNGRLSTDPDWETMHPYHRYLDEIISRDLNDQAPIPYPDIDTKKSWSPAFKHLMTVRRNRERRKYRRALNDVLHSSEPAFVKVAKLAALGVKV